MWEEIREPANKKQVQYIVILMTKIFGDDRKRALLELYGKNSTKDFTFEEAQDVIKGLQSFECDGEQTGLIELLKELNK